jgi:hypothetical protein
MPLSRRTLPYLSRRPSETHPTLSPQASNENVSPVVIKKILKDIREFEKDKPEGITLVINDENMTDIQAVITGPGACDHDP